jgi:OOP family OmpA-OmpF porin
MDPLFRALPRLRPNLALVALVCGLLPLSAQAGRHPLKLYGLAARASAQEVQNSTGNAFALQVGLSPRLRLEGVAVGLKLLLEYGALRDTQHRVFSAPSAQLLLDWAAAPRLELAVGAGAQFWFAPAGPLTRPVVTLEAHYVPPIKLWRVIRSGFVASSIGASSGAGLQVRAGIELDLGRQPAVAATPIAVASEAAACPAAPPCPPCNKPEPPAPISVAAVPVRQALGHTLRFAFNVTALNDDAKTYLRHLGAALRDHADDFGRLTITGHASSPGTAAHNVTVSVRRAHNVAQALLAAGVPPHKLTVHGVGEAEPLVEYPAHASQQQCVVLHLEGAAAHSALQDLITLPAEPREEHRP